MANKVLDAYLVYQLVQRLVTPFEKWDAYKLGIIDKDGNVLRKAETPKEKSAWGRFDIMVANLKKLLGKLPGGKSNLANYAAAAFLFKEQTNYEDATTLEENFILYLRQFEDVAVNSAGGGNIAGIGVGPQGEPPMGRNAQLKRIKKMLKRVPPNVAT
jgi:hypothetical protein